MEQHALFNLLLALFLCLWLSEYMNFHEWKVVCFPCEANLKGQSIWRKAGKVEETQGQPRVYFHCPRQGPAPYEEGEVPYYAG